MNRGTLAVGVEQPDETEQLVLSLVTSQADALLRTARRYSLCADDAHEAYQRAMEIFLRHAHGLDRETAASWLRRVVKHEALAVRRNRLQLVGEQEVDPDRQEARHLAGPDEHAEGAEEIERAAEALQRLKPDEVRALWLQVLGRSYEQIAAETGWSRTKVNRCLAEGRKTFLSRYAGIEAGEECTRWSPVLSAWIDGEASREERSALKPHLRNCAGCRATVRELRAAQPQLAAVFPAGGLALAAAPGDGPGFFVRSYEAVTHFLADKATASAIKVQAAIDVVGSGKAAAVAASAAAVAGGGAAVVESRMRDEQPVKVERRSASIPARAPRTISPTQTVSASARPAATTTTTERPASVQVVRRPKQRKRRAVTAARREFTPAPRPAPTTREFIARPTAAPAAAPPRPKSSARTGAEFGF